MTQETPRVVARKKLIEVALPLDAINAATVREKYNPFLKGHPRALHHWWSPKPLAGARGLIFAQLVDDPSASPNLFPSERAQETERQRLFRIIEDLVKWENTTNEEILQRARNEIWQSWRRACADNAHYPRAKELFNRHVLPAFHDPFAGGGAIPLEAQRLGLEAHASDLNPVAVVINKAKIEVPPKFAGRPPVNPQAHAEKRLMKEIWRGAEGLAEDVRYYGRWMRDEAENRIGHLYPKVLITQKMTEDRPDLTPYVGRNLTVSAWLWARTVKSPNPGFANVDVPLAATFVLSNRRGKEAYVEPVIAADGYRFTVKAQAASETARRGTKITRGANFRCIMSDTPIAPDYVKSEGQAGRMGARLMAIVAEGDRSRVYLPPTSEHEEAAHAANATWIPETRIGLDRRSMFTPLYGMTHFKDLFTKRQLAALTTFSDLIAEARRLILDDAKAAGMQDDERPLRDGGIEATAYSDAISIYLALALSKLSDYSNSICIWNSTNQNTAHMFSMQAIPMSWNFAESSPLHYGLSFDAICEMISRPLDRLPSLSVVGNSFQSDSASMAPSGWTPIIQTDPPYYDNISYADLSDFFYIWLRRALRTVLPDLFATLAVPKSDELVANPYRHGSKKKAEEFFLDRMSKAMQAICEHSHPAFPVAVYYAFKQSERRGVTGPSSTGWETFLDAVVRAGFTINGTWPVRTERPTGMKIAKNALASSIVLVCRPRPKSADSTTRREFQEILRSEYPGALADLQRGNIAPVDLAQASIGPGMAIFTRYSTVHNADGTPMSVRDALALVNACLDEVLTEQEGDFDADTRWAVTWFGQNGFTEGQFGSAETLSKAKNTSVEGLVQAGIVKSGKGKVRILRPAELDEDWEPLSDMRLTVWEITHHLIRALEFGGEEAAARVAATLGSQLETARDLAYRLYVVSERNKRAADALQYNSLVQSWPEIIRLSGKRRGSVRQGAFALDEA